MNRVTLKVIKVLIGFFGLYLFTNVIILNDVNNVNENLAMADRILAIANDALSKGNNALDNDNGALNSGNKRMVNDNGEFKYGIHKNGEIQNEIDTNDGNAEIVNRNGEINNETDELNFNKISKKKNGHNELTNSPQTQVTRFVYIPMMRGGSKTLQSIFQKFSHVRNFSYALPLHKKTTLGWPYKIQEQWIKKSLKVTGYDIIAESTVLSDELDKIAPMDAKFITMLRHPYNQFKSIFNHLGIASILNMANDESSLKTFLSNLQNLETQHLSERWNSCLPTNVSLLRNPQSFTLGIYPNRDGDTTSMNMHATEEAFKMLEEKLNVVMIMEYFYESLILLKRKFKWTFKEILHHKRGVRNYQYKTNQNLKLINKHRQYSNIDYKLYKHFNNTFWNTINSEPRESGFFAEVEYFRQIQNEMIDYCEKYGSLNDLEPMVVPRSKWSPKIEVSVAECPIYIYSQLRDMQRRYDQNAPHNIQEENLKRSQAAKDFSFC
ncbi:unnamed protein product [Owenia fusiformis]|uniref:Uncharacterized protein n=1 Tax=Owenia fusiformis TaxID=6347 RepID=A0A8J1XPC7_OWEFU|nr:unnamed protein product [Owenia fusiformis]